MKRGGWVKRGVDGVMGEMSELGSEGLMGE